MALYYCEGLVTPKSWAQNQGEASSQHFLQGGTNTFVLFPNFCMTQSEPSVIKFSSLLFSIT